VSGACAAAALARRSPLRSVNFLFAGWAVSWIINTHVSFIVGTSLLGAITLVLLITAGLLAFWLPADSRHP
jgi:hypothetical protein